MWRTSAMIDGTNSARGPSALAGDLAIMGLGRHLTTSAAVSPREAAAWQMSAEGKELTRRSSEAWGRASIAAGTDEAAATAAARRTTAFYTGESEADARV